MNPHCPKNNPNLRINGFLNKPVTVGADARVNFWFLSQARIRFLCGDSDYFLDTV